MAASFASSPAAEPPAPPAAPPAPAVTVTVASATFSSDVVKGVSASPPNMVVVLVCRAEEERELEDVWDGNVTPVPPALKVVVDEESSLSPVSEAGSASLVGEAARPPVASACNQVFVALKDDCIARMLGGIGDMERLSRSHASVQVESSLSSISLNSLKHQLHLCNGLTITSHGSFREF
jgi:hypothetical protein